MTQVAVTPTDDDPALLAFLDDLSEDCPDGAFLLSCYASSDSLEQIREEADLEDKLDDGRTVLSFLCLHPGSDIPESIVRVFTEAPSRSLH
jgi:hypothetical protein